jgi:gliding motility-associated-like protein
LDSLKTCTPVRLTANDGALNYVWYKDGLEVQQGLVDSLINAASGSYIIEDQACPADRDTFVLEIMMDIHLNLDTPYIFCEGDAIPIQLNGADVYSWSPSTFLSCDNCADPIVSPMADITYELAIEKGLCKDTLSISFVEDQNCITGNIYIPTAFSPNGDGVNDEFKVRYTGQYEGQIEVYDRWGKLVYQNELSQAWDGHYNSLLCPQGVYIYYLSYTTDEDITEAYSGNFTLIR